MLESLQAFGQALGNFTNSTLWIWLLIGTVWGVLIGLIPGIGALEALALCLPFAFKMQPMEALPLMVAIAACSFTGGSITAIVLGIPGDAPNAATVLDGFAMAKKGEAGRAIGAAVMASCVGGVAPVFLALAMMVAIVPIVMAVTSMDMVIVIFVGLAFIGVLGRGSMLKGLISGMAGLIIASIGLADVTGEPRFTFGNPFFYDGIHMVPLALGLFAIPPMVELIIKGGTIARTEYEFKGLRAVWEGAKDVFRNNWLWIRSSLIGYLFGIIPGVGANAAVWVAYAQAKQSSKHPELYGTGIVQGVIAPESCNNAKESGSLLTTLAIGIPGSGTGALQMGALIILGLSPGPQMITQHADLCFTLLIVVAVANIIGAAICFFLAPQLAKVALIPERILVPMVLVIVFAGSFTFMGSIEDVFILVIFSAVGVAVNRFGYNVGALFLGFILGGLFEKYLFLGLQLGGPFFFLRPISIALIIALVIFLTFRPVKNLLRNLF